MTPRDSGAHGFQKPAKIKISKPLINGIMKVPTKLMPIILKDCKFRFEQNAFHHKGVGVHIH